MTDTQTNKGEKTMRPVIVTTEFRGVFFGYADDTSGDTVKLKKARNCIYWSAKTGGFGGLASNGPGVGSRLGAVIDEIDLRKVTSVCEMSVDAVKAWEAFDVYRG
jgi:hypothetical protein